MNVGTLRENAQYATFNIGNRLYGIDVVKVQEVTMSLPMSRIPLAPSYVRGLINLRGQIATAIDLRNLFNIAFHDSQSQMNVVCNVEGTLLSFLVDTIGDVMEVSQYSFEAPPETVDDSIRKFMSGVYKLPNQLLTIIEVDKILKALNS
jgi:purine-binding chemotaxis protein CheW